MKKRISESKLETSGQIKLIREIIDLNEKIISLHFSQPIFTQLSSGLILVFSMFLMNNTRFWGIVPKTIIKTLRYLEINTRNNHKFEILNNYQALRKFKFPFICPAEGINGLPWQLTDLIPGNYSHFLFYFSRALDYCLKHTDLDASRFTEIYRSLNNYFAINNTGAMSEFKLSFYSQAKIISENFLAYSEKVEENFLKYLDQEQDYTLFIFKHITIAIHIYIFNTILTRFIIRRLDGRERSLLLYNRSIQNLKEQKRYLEITYQAELTFKEEQMPYIRILIKFILLSAVIVSLLGMGMTNSFGYLIPVVTAFYPHLVGLFDLDTEFFKSHNWQLKWEQQKTAKKLHILSNMLTSTSRLKNAFDLESVKSDESSTSYFLIKISPRSVLPARMLMSVLQKSLNSANISFDAEGLETVIFTNTELKPKQIQVFKQEFNKTYDKAENIRQLKSQLSQIVQSLQKYTYINHLRIEEGYLLEEDPKSSLHLFAKEEKALLLMDNIFKSFQLESKLEMGQYLFITGAQAMANDRLKLMIQKIIFALESLIIPEIKYPPQEIKAKKNPFNKNSYSAPSNPMPLPRENLVFDNETIIWDKNNVYPHPDIKPVSRTINRYIKFTLPEECFPDAVTRQRFYEKSQQMAKAGLGYPGIKHSIYSAHPPIIKESKIVGYRPLTFFPANIKLSGNDRVLCSIKKAPQTGKILYTAEVYIPCAH